MSKTTILLTGREASSKAGVHPQQLVRMVQRGTVTPTASTESGIRLYEPGVVRIILQKRKEMTRSEFNNMTHKERNAFMRRGGKFKR
jgi:DNA-binding transcriptional MerR regulator